MLPYTPPWLPEEETPAEEAARILREQGTLDPREALDIYETIAHRSGGAESFREAAIRWPSEESLSREMEQQDLMREAMEVLAIEEDEREARSEQRLQDQIRGGGFSDWEAAFGPDELDDGELLFEREEEEDETMDDLFQDDDLDLS